MHFDGKKIRKMKKKISKLDYRSSYTPVFIEVFMS